MKTIYTLVGYDSWTNKNKYVITKNKAEIEFIAQDLTAPHIKKYGYKTEEDYLDIINCFLKLAKG